MNYNLERIESMKSNGNLLKAVEKLKLYGIMAVIAILLIVAVAVMSWIPGKNESKPEIVTTTYLQKIIDISELSTFQAVYNGIAKVMNEKKPEKVDFYVAYEAKVNAGIDFKAVEIKIDSNSKIVSVKVPRAEISDVNVDFASMDYMFVNEKANTSTISEVAYKACIADVESESSEETAICEMAQINAINTVKALLSPFVNQLGTEYKLIVE